MHSQCFQSADMVAWWETLFIQHRDNMTLHAFYWLMLSYNEAGEQNPGISRKQERLLRLRTCSP